MPPRKASKSDSKTTRRQPQPSADTFDADEFADDGLMSAIDSAIIVDAGNLLKKGGYHPLLRTSDAESRLQWLLAHVAERRKISRKQHLEQIVQAYALFALSRDEPEIRDTIVQLAIKRRITVNAATSELRLFVEAFVSYGTEEDDAKRANHAFSRDVAAIRTLIKRRVLPSQVVALASGTGEGLDAWARANAKTRQQMHATVTDTPIDGKKTPTKTELRPTVLTLPPRRSRFVWTAQMSKGNVTMLELDFLSNPQTDAILFKCYHDLDRWKSVRPPLAPQRLVVKRKPGTLNTEPRAIPNRQRRSPAL